MDPFAAGLFALIRATSTFSRKGDTSPEAMEQSTRMVADRATSALTHLLFNSAVQPEDRVFNLRATRDLLREFDGLLARRATMDPNVIEALWSFRGALLDRMKTHGEGGELVAETVDLLPAALGARQLAEAAAGQKAAPTPITAPPAEAAKPPEPAKVEAAPAPAAEAAPAAPEAPAGGDRLEGDNFRFGNKPKDAGTPLQLTPDMLVAAAPDNVRPIIGPPPAPKLAARR